MSSNITKTPMGAVPARSVNQATSHTRPPSPSATRGAGSERPLFPTDLQPPTGFGALSTVYDHPRGRSDRDGFHTFIYAPPKASEDTAEPDNDPNTGNGLNVRMNDPLNHPLFEGYYTYEGRRYEELTGFEKRVLEMAVHYPYIAKGIMRVRESLIWLKDRLRCMHLLTMLVRAHYFFAQGPLPIQKRNSHIYFIRCSVYLKYLIR